MKSFQIITIFRSAVVIKKIISFSIEYRTLATYYLIIWPYILENRSILL